MTVPAARPVGPIPASRAELLRVGFEMLTLVLLLAFAWQLIAAWNSEWARLYAGGDLGGYLEGARTYVATGSPYLPEQVAGPWALQAHSFVHPPPALVLFVPFLVLPAVLWWVLPLGTTVLAIARLRPARWTWPVLVLCLIWPRSIGSLIAGNSDMWAMAIVAVGVVFGWPLVLIMIKPTFVPFALLHIRRKMWWVAFGVVAALNVVALPLWLDYVAVIRNSQLRLDYSLLNLPLVALPAIAWLGRSQPPAGSPPPAG